MRSTTVRKLGFWLFFAAPAAIGGAFAGCGSSSSGASDDSSIDASGIDASGIDTSLADSSGGGDTGTDTGGGGPCAAGKTYVDPDSGATLPVPSPQVINAKMIGCPGAVYWKDRDSLCAPSCRACSAAEWVSGHGNVAPQYHYWTSSDLGWKGGFRAGFICYAGELDASPGYYSPAYCSSDPFIRDGGLVPDGGGDTYDGGIVDTGETPMRVCTSNPSQPPFAEPQYDALGNQCNWTRCIYGNEPEPVDAGPDAAFDAGYVDPDAAPPSFDFMGGCEDNYTAGTLCCCP